MCIQTKVKAFLGFSLTLLSLNAFPFIGQKYLEQVFNDDLDVNLIAEDVSVLNAGNHVHSSLDPLSLQIFLSETPQQEYHYAIHTLKERLSFYTKVSNHVALAQLYQVSGMSKAIKGDIVLANDLFLKALNQYQFIDSPQELAVLSQNLSWIYYIQNDFDKALIFSGNAIAAMGQANNKRLLFRYLIWQNQILLAQGKASQVENEILKRVLMMASGSHKKSAEWECFYQLGKSYLLQNKLVQAKWFFIQALTLSDNFKSRVPRVKSLLMLARAKRRTSDYGLALQDITSAQSLIRNSGSAFEIDIAKLFAAVYRSLGNAAKEKQYMLTYNRLKKTALNT